MSYNQYVNPKAFTWKCQICNEFFKTRNLLSTHKKENHTKEELKSIYSTANKQGTFYCKYCNRISTTKSGNTNHEKYCIENPIKEVYKSHPISDEVKLKISKTQSENCRNRIGWNNVLGRSKQSYAESYFDSILESRGIECSRNLHVDKYWLDYAFEDKKIYFEVDGEQHYTDKGVAHDNERTRKLEELGWKCLARIRWSLFSRMGHHKKQEVVEELISAIANSTVPNITYKEDPKIVEREALEKRKAEKKEYWSKEWERRKKLIIDSGVDLNKFGWVGKVAEATGLTRSEIFKTVKRTDLEVYRTKRAK